MLRTPKNSFALCALLSGSFSLSAGFEDLIPSAYVAIPTFSAAIVGIKVARYTYQQRKVTQRTDQQATEYVTKILTKNNALKNNESISAFWGDWYTARSDAVIEIPKEHAEENQELAEFAILHEMGHMVNKDIQKSMLFDIAIACSIFSSFFTQKPEIIVTIACSAFPLERLFFRHRERQADRFAINHIKNPALLETVAEIFSNSHTENGSLPLWLWKKIMRTHPSELERAEYLQAAADAMRARQKNT